MTRMSCRRESVGQLALGTTGETATTRRGAACPRVRHSEDQQTTSSDKPTGARDVSQRTRCPQCSLSVTLTGNKHNSGGTD